METYRLLALYVYSSCGRYLYLQGALVQSGCISTFACFLFFFRAFDKAGTHASILSEVTVDSFTPDDSNIEEAAMSCMETVDSDDDSHNYLDVMG